MLIKREMAYQQLIKTAADACLTPRESSIFYAQLIYEDKGEFKTLETLGSELSLSRERCRQIRNVATDKVTKYIKKLDINPDDLFEDDEDEVVRWS